MKALPALVSIPFIAGQWSLPNDPSLQGARLSCFNPLHCGAVVASGARRDPAQNRKSRFNPLHCGAVVASSSARPASTSRSAFQSPSLRGSGRFKVMRRQYSYALPEFQSPSLRGSGRFAVWRAWRAEERARFNPLHCGAVVASGHLPGGARCSSRFNPLHCGAVVASKNEYHLCGGGSGVSIPFIAGQWSLLPSCRPSPSATSCFNPLHCGAVVASGGKEK